MAVEARQRSELWNKMIRWQQLFAIGLLFLSACAPASIVTPTQTAVSTATPATPTSTAQATATEPKPTIIPSPVPATATLTPIQPTAIPATAIPATAIPTAVEWKTHIGSGFELEYPGDWAFVGPDGFECTGLYHFFPSSLELMSFSACWEDHVGGNMLTFAKTFERFRNGFIDDALISSQTINEIQVETIQYNSVTDNGIYIMTSPQGTLSLWQNGDRGWALIDQGNQHQEDGRFDQILASFKFDENQ